MKCQILFSEKNKNNIINCRLLNLSIACYVINELVNHLGCL